MRSWEVGAIVILIAAEWGSKATIGVVRMFPPLQLPLQELAALTFIIDKEQDFCLLNSLEIFY